MEQTKVADFSQLIASMTLDEKIGMIHGSQLFRTAGISRLGIPPLTFSDGTMGVRQEFLPDSWEILERNDDYVTYLPCAAALAASWNRELAEQTENGQEEAENEEREEEFCPLAGVSGILVRRDDSSMRRLLAQMAEEILIFEDGSVELVCLYGDLRGGEAHPAPSSWRQ